MDSHIKHGDSPARIRGNPNVARGEVTEWDSLELLL